MNNSDPITNVVEHAEIAAQNQEAASSTPLDAAVGTQSEVAGADTAASGVAAPSTLGTSEPGEGGRTEPLMFVNPAVRVALAEHGIDQAANAHDDEVTQQELNQQLEAAVFKDVSSALIDDTGPEEQLAAAISGFIRAGKERYAGLLEQATTQAEILRCLSDAIIHLNDHVAQRVLKEQSNG